MRYYNQLECGCLISCDGAGGLIPGCTGTGKVCKVSEYMKEHEMLYDVCKKCNPEGYKGVLQDLRNHCLECYSTDMLNYFTKPDGEIIKEYWRCNNCTEIIELRVNKEGEVIVYHSFYIYENLS